MHKFLNTAPLKSPVDSLSGSMTFDLLNYFILMSFLIDWGGQLATSHGLQHTSMAKADEPRSLYISMHVYIYIYIYIHVNSGKFYLCLECSYV